MDGWYITFKVVNEKYYEQQSIGSRKMTERRVLIGGKGGGEKIVF